MDHKPLEIVEASNAQQIWAQINLVLARIKKLQGDIAATDEPASQLEIAELKELGKEYAALVQQLETSGDTGSS